MSTESVGSRRQLVANCVHTADADATKQFRRVGGVYWASAYFSLVRETLAVKRRLHMTIGLQTGIQTVFSYRFAYRSPCVKFQIHCLQSGRHIDRMNQTCVNALAISLHTRRKYLVADWLIISMTLMSYIDITSQQVAVISEWTEDEFRKLIENVKDHGASMETIDHADYGKRGPRFLSMP